MLKIVLATNHYEMYSHIELSLNEDSHFTIKCIFFTCQRKCIDHINMNWVIKYKKKLFELNILYVQVTHKTNVWLINMNFPVSSF